MRTGWRSNRGVLGEPASAAGFRGQLRAKTPGPRSPRQRRRRPGDLPRASPEMNHRVRGDPVVGPLPGAVDYQALTKVPGNSEPSGISRERVSRNYPSSPPEAPSLHGRTQNQVRYSESKFWSQKRQIQTRICLFLLSDSNESTHRLQSFRLATRGAPEQEVPRGRLPVRKGAKQEREIGFALHFVDHDGSRQALQGRLRFFKSGQTPRVVEIEDKLRLQKSGQCRLPTLARAEERRDGRAAKPGLKDLQLS